MNDYQAAFPSVIPFDEGRESEWVEGMTLHDWFVGQALAGCSTSENSYDPVKDAFAIADQVMAERKKRAGE